MKEWSNVTVALPSHIDILNNNYKEYLKHNIKRKNKLQNAKKRIYET